ncbi:Arpin [Balamuthia mandrillaris]
MIHHSTDLTLGSGQTKWTKGPWDPSSFQKGDGIIVEGKLVHVRNHSVSDSTTSRHYRYSVVVVDVTSARKRTWSSDDSGKRTEVDNLLPSNETIQWRGYLTTQRVAVQDPNLLTPDQLLRLLGPLPNGFYDQGLSSLHPSVPGRFEFWGDPNLVKPLDLSLASREGAEGAEVIHLRMKTLGDGIFLESISKKQDRAPNYAGENVQGGWGGKIMNLKKDGEEEEEEEKDDRQGVDEEEWDD